MFDAEAEAGDPDGVAVDGMKDVNQGMSESHDLI